MKTRKILGATLLGAAFAAASAGAANAADGPGDLPALGGLSGLGSGIGAPDGLLEQTGKLNGVGKGTLGEVTGAANPLDKVTSLGQDGQNGTIAQPSVALGGVTDNLGGLGR